MNSRRILALFPLVILPACGGGPSSPSGPGTTPTAAPGYAVSGEVFYDENGNGTLDAGEVVRLPGVTVSVGGRTGQATAGGLFTVSGVPAGTQSARVEIAGLPAYFTAGPEVTVAVPQSGAPIAVSATLEIGDRNRPNYYLAFGDSITFGVGGGPGNDYPSFLTQDLRTYWGEASIINAGAPGTKSNLGERRMWETVTQHRPAYTLILYGTNDWNESECRSSFPCFTIDSLRSMIYQARDAGSNPVIGTIPPANPAYEDRLAAERNEWIVAMNQLLREMATQNNVPIAEIHADFMSQPDLESLFVDHVHPNDVGYQLMARSWFDALTGAEAAASRRSFGFSRP